LDNRKRGNGVLSLIRRHDRYDYWPINEPAPFHWPEGQGLAVYVALNIEQYSFGDGVLDELVPSGGPPPDVINYAWLDYGNRVGAWRLMELMGSLDLPLTCLVNSAVYDSCPGLIEAFAARGDEIAAHGRSNAERQDLLDEAAERALIEDATSKIAEAHGKAPAGWLGPWIAESEVTPDLLKEAGYRYLLDWCADDRPFPLRTRSGPLLAVPYPQEANDANAIAVRRMTASDFADLVVDQFDEMLMQASAGPLVCAVSLHPHIAGQPHRLRQLRRAFAHIAAAREQIWLTTAGRIADVAGKGFGLD
jgi:peptidoglycan/xylan/chitin deacetylase (PgdA/CDA1 family)